MTSNEPGRSSSVGGQQHPFDQTSLPPLGTATITRSMSRKSLSTAPFPPKQQHSTITQSTALSQSTARPPLASARRVSTSHPSTAQNPQRSGEKPKQKRQIRPIGSATSSAGMGVRRGPAVVRSASSLARHEKRVERRSLSPAKLSPAKLAQPSLSNPAMAMASGGVNDPFSVEFRYAAVGGAGERRVEGGRKRSIGDVEEVDGTNAGGMRRTKSIKGVLLERSGELPTKRLHISDLQQTEKKLPSSDKPSTTTRTLSSPARARVRSRTRTQSDENAVGTKPKSPSFDNYLSAPLGRTSAMEVDNQVVLSSPSTSTNSTEASRRGMDNPDDDELDFISPRKKRAVEVADRERGDREATGGIRSPIRSPMQRKRITSPIRSPPRLLEEGVPTSRIPQSLSSVVASPLFAAPVSRNNIPLSTIDPSLPTASTSTASTLTSKYARPSLPLNTVDIPSALATSQPMKRSGIPRPTPSASFPPIYNPHQSSSTLSSSSRTLSRSTSTLPSSNNPPRRISNAALSSRYARSRDPNGDESMSSNSTLLFESDPMTTIGGGGIREEEGNVSVADETAARLANLQAMLSRLAMPRQSLAGVAMAGTNFIPEKRVPSSSTTTGMGMTSHLEKQRERRRTTMTGSFREEYTMPLSGGETKMGPPKGIPGRHAAGRASISGPTPSSSSSLGTTRPSTLSTSTNFVDEPVFRKTVPPSTVSSASRGDGGGGAGVAGTSHIRAPRKSTLLPSSSSTAILSSLLDDTHAKENAPPSHPSSLCTTTATAGGGGADTTMLDGRVQIPKHTFLKDVVAFVDVRTLEGDDAGMIFVDMLKSMSARVRLIFFSHFSLFSPFLFEGRVLIDTIHQVTTRPTPSLTHIIYKSGRPSTLTRYKASPASDRPFLVGISWVVRCAELGKRVDEGGYTVQEGKESVGKRRRSMEPRLLAIPTPVGGGVGGKREIEAIGPGITANTSARKSFSLFPASSRSRMIADCLCVLVQATIAASIDRARRKSLQFQPKSSFSPPLSLHSLDLLR